MPLAALDGIDKLAADLLVWDIDFSAVRVEGEISEMDQQGKHIVPAPESYHVILEFIGVGAAVSAAEHLDDIVLQTVKIHTDSYTFCSPLTARCAFRQKVHWNQSPFRSRQPALLP